jgi:hypothetical protein
MKYVLFYEAVEDFAAKVPEHFEAHRALWKEYSDAGTLLLIGPFTDTPFGGAMEAPRPPSSARHGGGRAHAPGGLAMSSALSR